MKHYLILFICIFTINASWAIGDSTIVVNLSTSVGNTYNQAYFSVEIQFDTTVYDIDETAFEVINGYTNNLRIGTNYGKDWTIDIWPYNQGKVGVLIPAGVTKNNPDNNTWNAASDTLWVYIDYSRPSFTLTSTAPNPTNQSQINVNIKASEYVTDFIKEDFFISNATIVAFDTLVQNHEWSLNLAVIQDGDIKVCIPEAKALDTASNINYASDTLSRRFDTQRPNVSISSTEPYLSNQKEIKISIVFDEEITGMDTLDFYLNNSNLLSLTDLGNNKNFEATIEPIGDGEFSIAVLENAVLDLLNNPSTPSDTLHFKYDGISPRCVLSTLEKSPTAEDTLSFEVEFSETVSNLSAANIYYSRGKVINLTNTVDSLKWTYDIVNTISGTVSTKILASSVNDPSMNYNTESNSLSIVTDHTPPTCNMYTTASNPTNKDSLLINVSFSEPIKNFSLEDINYSGGTISNLIGQDSASEYSFYAHPQLGESLMILGINDSSYNDILGHYGSAYSYLYIQYDIDNPTLSIESSLGNVVHTSFAARFLFNETVQGFTGDSIHVENGVASGLYESKSGLEWSVTISPIEKGKVNIWLGKEAATDAAGNKSLASDTLVVDFNDDIYGPIPTLSSDISSPTNKSYIPIYIEFDEEVTNFSAEDIDVDNAIVSNFQQITANKKWKLNVIPTSNGWVQAQVKSNVCEDLSSNTNVQSNVLIWQVDMTVPILTISTTASSPTRSTNLYCKFNFSEEVDSFDVEDILVTNGRITNFSSITSHKLWSGYISSIDSDGLVSVFVPENVAFDVASNANPASDTINIIYDGTEPEVSFSSYLNSDTTYYDTVTVRLLFSEQVSGFSLTNLSFYNATLDNYSAPNPGLEYFIRLKAKSTGIIGLQIPYAIVQDQVGNVNAPYEKTFVYAQKSSAIEGLKNAGLSYYVFNKNLYLNYQKTILQPDNLKIYNIQGKLILTKKLFGQSNFNIPLPFNDGIYLLMLEQNKKNYSEKIYIGNKN